MKKIFITGGTGFVGSSFLIKLLSSEHESIKVFALVRGSSEAHLENKLYNALLRSANALNMFSISIIDLMDKIVIIEGDIRKENFGISSNNLNYLKSQNIDEIWHIASYLHPKYSEANIKSTNSLIDLRNILNISAITYLSTAYVFGKSQDKLSIHASPPDDVEHNNEYEKSKYLSEKLLTQMAKKEKVNLSIYRPTIIVGSRNSKLTFGSKNGLYGVINRLNYEQKKDSSMGKKSIVCKFGNGKLNLVYIERIIEILCDEFMLDKHNDYLYTKVISGVNVEMKSLYKAMEDRLGLSIIIVENENEIPSNFKKLNTDLDFFTPYTLSANLKIFYDDEIKEKDYIYDIDLLNLIESSVNESNHNILMNLVNLDRIVREDNSYINSYINKKYDARKETVVIVNAYGMPINIMHPLINAIINKNMNVISWDSRGLPDYSYDITKQSLKIKDHLSDWHQVKEHYNLDKCNILGWSTGAAVASYIVYDSPGDFSKLLLLNGSFMHENAELTLFQKNLKSIMPKIALSRKIASIIFKSVFDEDKSKLLTFFTKDIAYKSKEAMSVIKPEHKHLVQLLTLGPEEVFRYAMLVKHFVKEEPMEWLRKINISTYILTCDKDITAAPQGSYDAHKAIPNSKIYTHIDGDHMSLYSDEYFINKITELLLEVPIRDAHKSKVIIK